MTKIFLAYTIVCFLFACTEQDTPEETVIVSSMGECIEETLGRRIAESALGTVFWQKSDGVFTLQLETYWYCDFDQPVVATQLTDGTLFLSMTRTNTDFVPGCSCATQMSFDFADTTGIRQVHLGPDTWAVSSDSL